jgi:hypothetical protein
VRPSTHWSIVDLLIAAALIGGAYALRLHSFPHDGLFYDDAWQAASITLTHPSEWLRTSVEHPGFTVLLSPLRGVARHHANYLVVPVFAVGVLAPAVVFGFLRALAHRRSVACALATLVVVTPTAIGMSSHVKTYVADLCIVATLAVVLVPLSNTRWRAGLAAAWVVAAILVGTFSVYALIATAVAAIVLVMHPSGDVRVRVIAVAVQAVVQAGYLALITRTYSTRALHDAWAARGGFVEIRRNPLTTLGDFTHHIGGVFSVYPSHTRGLTALLGAVAIAGLLYAATRTRAVSARFLLLLFATAAAGGVLQLLPFGVWNDNSYFGRLTLWLVPAIALGLAEAARFVSNRLGRSAIVRTSFDVGVYVFAVAAFVASIGNGPPYTLNGSRAASAYIDAHRMPDDLVVLVPTSAYPYAIETHAPAHVRPDSHSIVGTRVVFDHHTVQYERGPAPDIRNRLRGVDTVYLYSATPIAYSFRLALPVALTLQASGFHERTRKFGGTALYIWTRPR